LSTKRREVVWGGRIMGAEIRARGAREAAQKAIRDADRAEAEAWSPRMEGYGGPAQPSPTIGQCLNGGLGWLEVECHRCKTRASLPLDAIRRSRDTPIWKLEASLKCRSCKKGGHAPLVHLIRLTEAREPSRHPRRYSEHDVRSTATIAGAASCRSAATRCTR
jgi:hypothetical protein